MFSSLRKHFGSAGPVSVIALVAALATAQVGP